VRQIRNWHEGVGYWPRASAQLGSGYCHRIWLTLLRLRRRNKYLRRITPPEGFLMDKFADAEQLQMDLLEIEPLKSESNI